jgi:hypothetical protein
MVDMFRNVDMSQTKQVNFQLSLHFPFIHHGL